MVISRCTTYKVSGDKPCLSANLSVTLLSLVRSFVRSPLCLTDRTDLVSEGRREGLEVNECMNVDSEIGDFSGGSG